MLLIVVLGLDVLIKRYTQNFKGLAKFVFLVCFAEQDAQDLKKSLDGQLCASCPRLRVRIEKSSKYDVIGTPSKEHPKWFIAEACTQESIH